MEFGMNRLRVIANTLEKSWGCRPHFILACGGGTDEHWQIFHIEDIEAGLQYPVYTIRQDGFLDPHPDGRFGANMRKRIQK